MNNLLAIVGATGTGKTSLAIKLGKLFPSTLISADSRQVYQGMDIVTGKDHPQDTVIHGVDLVAPDQDCSVAVWSKQVIPTISQAHTAGQLPIVVGGTGLYIKALVDGIPTMSIKPNPVLRRELSSQTVSMLQEKLSQHDKARLDLMNQSDRNNPRRLIRAIEIASSQYKPRQQDGSSITSNYLIIGLKYADNSRYRSLVRDRVQQRLASGAIKEAKTLLDKYSSSLPAFTSLGYRHLIRYLAGHISHDQLVEDWTQQEISYSKRQLTWFSKVQNIHWFDPLDFDYPAQVASLVKDWYSKHS